MTHTLALIDQLAGRAGAVRPLPSPMRRTVVWIAVALVLIAIMVASIGLRPHLLTALLEPSEAIGWIGSVLTGIFAAYAAFQISVPGRSPSWAWLPALPVAFWLAGIGAGCLNDFAAQGAAAFAFETRSGECARAILMMSLPLTLAMVIMVRHAGAVRPAPTALLAALSAAALSSAGVSLIHAGENALMVLVWHFGAVLVLSLLSVALGSKVFSWIGHARRN
ncbi:MAG: NrsF family protein [Arenimonas sp.]